MADGIQKHEYVDPRPPVLGPGHDLRSVTSKIADIVFMRGFQKGWVFGFAVAFLGALMLFNTIAYLVLKGIGIWGNNIPVGWAFDIINFVWWIGIGHAGTLISAILLLLRQSWRNSINRFAEAMTLFAVACAAMFPLLHTGRPWLAAYWMFPYPNTMGLWPQFRSPLVWDAFAIGTYATVSLMFWFVGLIPDLAGTPSLIASEAMAGYFDTSKTEFRLIEISRPRWLVAISLRCGGKATTSPP